MVSRRTYIGAIIAAGTASVYTLTRPESNREIDLDVDVETITFSGSESPFTTEEFRVDERTPGIITTTTESNNKHQINLVKRGSETEFRLVENNSSTQTKRLFDFELADYIINIEGEIESWQINIELYQSIPERGTFSNNIPLSTNGSGREILEPISLAPDEETTITFEIDEAQAEEQILKFTDRNGLNWTTITTIQSGETNSEITETFNGSGFIIVDSTTDWTLEITK